MMEHFVLMWVTPHSWVVLPFHTKSVTSTVFLDLGELLGIRFHWAALCFGLQLAYSGLL